MDKGQLFAECTDDMARIKVRLGEYEVVVSLEELYQHFAERFRRENHATRSFTDWGNDGTWTEHVADIVEIDTNT